MKNIKEITIVLENCEEFAYKASDFGEFAVGDIHEEISRVACNAIGHSKVANKICIELFSKAKMQKCVFNGEIIDSFKRIADYNDITQFVLTYDNDETETLYVNYEDEENFLGAPNKNQRCMLSSLGNLYIIIDSNENKTFKDYFNLDKTNDTDYMEFYEDIINDD